MKYKNVIATRRGGPEVLKVVEQEIHPLSPQETRIRVLATGVGGTDVNYRYGLSLFSPKTPFVPGYEIMGVVEAVGDRVKNVAVGDRVAALIGHGGYTEIICIAEEHLVPVSPGLNPADVVAVVLNYVTAYQMLHRVAKVKSGDKVLVNGASGGVGTALMELGKLAGLKMYGTASPGKHDVLISFGVTPIDYHTQDFLEVISHTEPEGLDFVFDGIGGEQTNRGLAVLGKGGKLVAFAAPGGLRSTLSRMLKMLWINLIPNAKSATFYGITALYLRDRKPFKEDVARLLKWLEEGQIKPIISARFPILEARAANELLESGKMAGNIVLLSPKLL
jgi:NADPH:quinone reductase-like Zn-dependent oxidoreductase